MPCIAWCPSDNAQGHWNGATLHSIADRVNLGELIRAHGTAPIEGSDERSSTPGWAVRPKIVAALKDQQKIVLHFPRRFGFGKKRNCDRGEFASCLLSAGAYAVLSSSGAG